MHPAKWHPAIGDPTVFGWITVVAYAVGAVMAGLAVHRARIAERAVNRSAGDAWRDCRSIKRFWILVTVTMVVLGINKQLDLQSLFIEKVRNRAYVDGWYGQRRIYQEDFIALMMLMALVVSIGAAFWLRRVLSRIAVALAGLAMLLLFVLVRAASFHYVDKVLALGDSVKINVVLELGGILSIIGATSHWITTERRRPLTGVPPQTLATLGESSVGAASL